MNDLFRKIDTGLKVFLAVVLVTLCFVVSLRWLGPDGSLEAAQLGQLIRDVDYGERVVDGQPLDTREKFKRLLQVPDRMNWHLQLQHQHLDSLSEELTELQRRIDALENASMPGSRKPRGDIPKA